MWKLLSRLILVFVLIPAGLVGLFYQLESNGFFNISQIPILIEQNSQHEQFLKPLVLDLESHLTRLRGQSLVRVDLKDIKAKIAAQSWIQNVQLSRRFPDQLQVSVVPKKVKLLYLSDSHDLRPVLDDGSFLKSIPAHQAPDVAILEGSRFAQDLPLRKKAVEVISQVPETGKFSVGTISSIRYDAKEGFWATMIESGIQVKLGQDRFFTKSSRVSQVLEYLENREMNARVIDADLSKKVLVRLRKGP
ncbi:MAG: FtsQ-type POTRA domain-containing protein [Proteobacteria bacterium]|jgi:cell division protein FtsQ|nr:FtsQ-type POTRA domain-containing protein [Pseudomonadota bacterium]